jgi:hypothetical protein
MPDAAVESGAKPSAQGRSEVFPALNRFLTPERNVRSDGGQGFPNAKYRVWRPVPTMEPPPHVSPLNRPFFLTRISLDKRLMHLYDNNATQ